MSNLTPNSYIPISILTGFLGAGKTTFLNQILENAELKNTAIIINEFGDISLDHLLVETADEAIIELSSGCLCCTVQGDLVNTLNDLLGRLDEGSINLDRIIIETTGLADPAPILHVAMAHPRLSTRLRLESIITLIDAVNAQSTLDNHEEAVKQAAVADLLILSKSDLIENNIEKDALITRLEHLNPSAKILDRQRDEISPNSFFNHGLYDHNSKSLDVQRWLKDEADNSHDSHVHDDHHAHHHHKHNVNRHDAHIHSISITSDEAIDSIALQLFLDLLSSHHGPNLLRFKGIVKIKENPEQPVVIHGVQHIFHPPHTLPAWPDESRQTKLVMITKDMDEEFVKGLFNAFNNVPATDTPDREALANNPLAIPGEKF
jgi:G3E family GTPase